MLGHTPDLYRGKGTRWRHKSLRYNRLSLSAIRRVAHVFSPARDIHRSMKTGGNGFEQSSHGAGSGMVEVAATDMEAKESGPQTVLHSRDAILASRIISAKQTRQRSDLGVGAKRPPHGGGPGAEGRPVGCSLTNDIGSPQNW